MLESTNILIDGGYKVIGHPEGYAVNIAWTSTEAYNQDGTIAELHFSLKDNANSGKAYINTAFRGGYDSFYGFVNGTEQDIAFDAFNGYVDVNNHHFGEWVVTTPATCTATGLKIRTCSDCSKTETVVIPKVAHEYASVITPPTCTAKGYTTHTCKTCSDYYIDTYVDMVEHTPGEWKQSIAPECEVKGEEIQKCTVCKATINTRIVDETGHDFDDWFVVSAAKFNEDGQERRDCKTCNYFETKRIPKLSENHTCDYTGAEEIIDDATCTEKGSKKVYCTAAECGKYITIDIEATGHSYVGGNCISCGEKNPDDAGIIKPQLTLSYPSLSFEDEILYNVYYTLDNASSIVEMGLITFESRLVDGTTANAVDIIPGYVNSGSTYMAQSNGIPAKNLGDAVYFKVYAKLTDGSYVYSDIAGYHAVAYANSVLKSNAADRAKALVVAMLNYGAAAQEYFGYKTDALMNAGLTAEQQALVQAYDPSMVQDVVKADASKVGPFVMNGGYSNIWPTVSFKGAFSINFYFTPNKTVDSAPILYYWDAETYNSAVVLSSWNATGVITMTQDGSNWGTAIDGIAAKAIDETIYVAGFYTSNGVAYPTGVIAYSLGQYCKTVAANGEAFGAATAVYGYYAKAYFN